MTGSHPIWSIDRRGWVDASALVVGEQVKTQDGFIRLQSKAKREGVHTVYNLEIYRDHNFLVSTDEILVHNACFSPDEHKIAYYLSSLGRKVVKNPLESLTGMDGREMLLSVE